MKRSGLNLVVDPIACTGHGICAELFPEWIGVDDWGYPMIDPGEVPEDLRAHAERAAKACPALALRLRAASGYTPDGQPVTRRARATASAAVAPPPAPARPRQERRRH